MARPSLILVTGPPGTGKTTLAHLMAKQIGCPAISRDEIKEGMAHSEPGEVASGDQLNLRTLEVFFQTLQLLLSAGVTLIAEAAFQDQVWRPRLEPLSELADLRVIACTTDPEVARERQLRRITQQHTRAAHADLEYLQRTSQTFVPLTLPVPTLPVDTTNGYWPPLAEIVSSWLGHKSGLIGN